MSQRTSDPEVVVALAELATACGIQIPQGADDASIIEAATEHVQELTARLADREARISNLEFMKSNREARLAAAEEAERELESEVRTLKTQSAEAAARLARYQARHPETVFTVNGMPECFHDYGEGAEASDRCRRCGRHA